VAGYGRVDLDTLFRSTDDEVVLLAEDSIQNDSHQFYELPVPDSFLRSNRATRQLRITLAYCPAVRTTRLDYTATKICFKFVEDTSLEEVKRHFDQSLKNTEDTMPEAKQSAREITSTEREKGTVQSSVWTFRQLSPAKKWFLVITRQDKDWGAPFCMEEEEYALVVTVSDRENQEAQLYTRIQARIQEQVRVHSRLQAAN